MNKIVVGLVMLAMTVTNPAIANTANDEQAVRKVIADYGDAWNKHDPDAILALFTDDADWSRARMDPAYGRSVDVQQLRVRRRPRHSTNDLPREEGQFFVRLLGIWDRSENLRTLDRWRAVDMSSSAGRAHDQAIRRLRLCHP